MWTLKLSRQAQRFFDTLTGKHAAQMRHALDSLCHDPHAGKMLQGELRGYWSYRVGMYRIVYVMRHREITVEVLRIAHRRDVYERMRG